MASSTPARAPCWGVPLLVAGRTGGWIDRPICATNLSFRRVPIAHLARSSYARRAPRVQHAVPQLPLELQAEESTKQQKEWKFSSWISTKRDIRAAVEECASKIKPKFGAAKPDICFVFSSHKSEEKLRRVPLLVKNALRPRALFGSSTFGVFGAGGGIAQGQEITDKQALTVVAATMPDVEIYPFHVLTPSLPSFPPDFDWAAHTLKKRYKYNANGGLDDGDEDLSSALFVITDGIDFREDELLRRLDFAFPHCPKFGGLASSRNVRLFVNDKAYAEGAAGLLLHGKFRLGQIKSEAFRPIGRAYKVSEVVPYNEKRFESLFNALGEAEERSEWEDEEIAQMQSNDQDEDEDEDEDDGELSSVIHGLDERTVHEIFQELADDLTPQDKRRLLAGQFLIGVDTRVPESGEVRAKLPSNYVARNVKEMEIGNDASEDGSYLALFENIPKGKYIRFCMKDRARGLVDLRDKLATLPIPASESAVASTTPPVPFCPLALEGTGTSEVGVLGFSSIGRSLYAQNTLDHIDSAQNLGLHLTGRTPLDVEMSRMVEQALRAEEGSGGDDVQEFIEGELASQPKGGNFILQPLRPESEKRSEEPKVEYLPQDKDKLSEDDIVNWTPSKRKEGSSSAEEDSRNREQIEELFEDSTQQTTHTPEHAERRADPSEEVETSLTDAEVIADRLGSRVTLAGMFCKGEFFTTRDTARDDDDERTVLHGYINSLAVIMPPQSYYERKHTKDK